MIKKSLVWLYSVATYLLWAGVILGAAVVLSLRYFVLPNIHEYKDAIAQQVSRAAGQRIAIGSIRASWDGLHPHLDLRQVVLHDARNRPALTLDHVETSLSWLSLALGEPRLSSLVIHQPRLTVRRETDGTIYVAGISMSGPSKPAFPNWLLRQARIDVLDASVVWQDDLRRAPPLTLERLNLQMSSPVWESLLGRHRFGLRAQPSAGSSKPIDIRGNLLGKDVSRPEQWRGTLYARLEGTDIAAWRNWITLPQNLRQGFGAAQVWLDFSKRRVDSVVSDVVLANVVTPLAAHAPETSLRSLSGRIAWSRLPDGYELRGERLRLSATGLEMRDGNLALRSRVRDGKEVVEGSLRLDDIGLEQLAAFSQHLPLGDETRAMLAEIAPRGRLQHLELDWGGTASKIEKYGLRGRFSGLGMNPYRGIPGFTGLSGSVDATEAGGTLTLSASNATLDFRDVLRWPIPADKLSGKATWKQRDGQLEVKVSNLALSSPHLAGSVNASYQRAGKGRGSLDLTGKFSRADGRFAQHYYPLVLSPHTLSWLDSSILAGRGEEVNVIVKGNLDEFPWADGKRGLFQVSAKISDGVLDYAHGWPRIDGIRLDLLFRGNRMELNAKEGRLYGNQITRAKVVIPVLDAPHPVLEVTGELQSPPAEAIRYINNSPVLDAIDRFTEGMQASGNGRLLLGLRIPLDTDGIGTRVKGSYFLSNAALAGNADVPPLEGIDGRLEFTESTLRAQNVSARLFGGPIQLAMENGADGLLRITAQGRIADSGIRQALDSPLAARLHGSTDWSGEINLRKRQADVVIRSSLAGLSSSLPPPFDKQEGDIVPLLVEKKTQGDAQDLVAISLGKVLSARLLQVSRDGKTAVERGELNFGGAAELPPQPGIALRGSLGHVDVDQWQSLMGDGEAAPPGRGGLAISRATLAVGTLDVFGRRINDLKLDAKAVADGWQADIQSREIAGEALWSRSGNGKITARLKSLVAPQAAPAKLSAPSEQAPKERDYPALDITADNFEIKQKRLGRLELIASQQGMDWNIDKLVIDNPDSKLTASGVWSSWKRRPHTRVSLSWNIADVGKTLERFGYPDTIKGGKADLTGKLRWPGSPHEFSAAGLDGQLQLDAKNGQFLKIRPGVGRLLGILSLQSLPRRLTFDFRDLFSAGFAFDKIGGNVRIDDGIMRSDDFQMEGPAAKVAIRGETDLARETQNLHIKVIPSIGDSLSVAAFAGGPAVGVAAIVAQKLLDDPFNKLIAYEYEITGTWDDPQEVKSKSGQPAPSPIPLGQ